MAHPIAVMIPIGDYRRLTDDQASAKLDREIRFFVVNTDHLVGQFA